MKSISPEEVPDRLVEVAEQHYDTGGAGLIRNVLAGVLPVFDDVIRAEIVRWIEAQMVKCPHGHDRDTGHRALCNWCWHNSALIGAANLARGDYGSRTAYALHRMEEEAATDA